MAHGLAWPALELQMTGSAGCVGYILAKQVLVTAEQVLAARAGRVLLFLSLADLMQACP